MAAKFLPKTQVAEILARIQLGWMESGGTTTDYHALRRSFESDTVARQRETAAAWLDNYTSGRPSFVRTEQDADELLTVVFGY